MRTIYKYPLKSGADFTYTVKVPYTHEVIHFGRDGEQKLCIWCEVYKGDTPEKELVFKVFGTGWDITYEGGLQHIKTIVEDTGLVWHFYQLT